MKIYVVSGFYHHNCDNCYELEELPTTVHKTVEEANKEVKNTFMQYKDDCYYDDITDESELDLTIPNGMYAYNHDTGCRVVINNNEFEI